MSVPQRFRFLAAALLAAALAAPAAHAEDPLRRLMPQKVGASLCFTRTYDAGHLARNPRQATHAVHASLKYEHDLAGVWLRVRFARRAKRAPLFVAAGCEWRADANRDTSNKPLIPAMRKDDGFVCIAIFNPSSAEEGGHIVFDLAPDGRGVTLYFEDEVAAKEGERGARRIKLNRDDRVFRLERTETLACRDLEAAVETQ